MKDIFTFSTVGDLLALKSITSLKASRNVIPNKKLTFQEVSIAKTLLFEHMRAQGWTKELVLMLTEFFLKLENHQK